LKVLVTGGAGYIGGHVVLGLKEKGYNVTVVDDLSKGYKTPFYGDKFIKANIQDTKKIKNIIRDNGIEAVFHFAAFIEAGESMKNPAKYFLNNSARTIEFLETIINEGVKFFIFSSTAALYGMPEKIPITEEQKLQPVNPYGESKLIVENVLKWFSSIYDFRYVSLRYFNAAGADEKLRCGERHNPESHLIPLAIQTAWKERDALYIYGTDYNTRDGTCIRDYIHVSDLADAHILALEYLLNNGRSDVFNLGNGKGFTVKEVVDVVKEVTGKDFPVIETNRRPGDPETLVASSDKIKKILGWNPKRTDLKWIVKTANEYYKYWKKIK